jgi:succinylglutamate desuccinylase
MNLQTIQKDIDKLEKSLKIIQGTDNYQHFAKSTLMLDICQQINVLKEKRDKQIIFINQSL